MTRVMAKVSARFHVPLRTPGTPPVGRGPETTSSRDSGSAKTKTVAAKTRPKSSELPAVQPAATQSDQIEGPSGRNRASSPAPADGRQAPQPPSPRREQVADPASGTKTKSSRPPLPDVLHGKSESDVSASHAYGASVAAASREVRQPSAPGQERAATDPLNTSTTPSRRPPQEVAAPVSHTHGRASAVFGETPKASAPRREEQAANPPSTSTKPPEPLPPESDGGAPPHVHGASAAASSGTPNLSAARRKPAASNPPRSTSTKSPPPPLSESDAAAPHADGASATASSEIAGAPSSEWIAIPAPEAGEEYYGSLTKCQFKYDNKSKELRLRFVDDDDVPPAGSPEVYAVTYTENGMSAGFKNPDAAAAHLARYIKCLRSAEDGKFKGFREAQGRPDGTVVFDNDETRLITTETKLPLVDRRSADGTSVEKTAPSPEHALYLGKPSGTDPLLAHVEAHYQLVMALHEIMGTSKKCLNLKAVDSSDDDGNDPTTRDSASQPPKP